jgi:hypothetical protein
MLKILHAIFYMLYSQKDTDHLNSKIARLEKSFAFYAHSYWN